jgi:hypothetical protein
VLAEREKLGKALPLAVTTSCFLSPIRRSFINNPPHLTSIILTSLVALHADTNSIAMASIPVDPLQKVVVKLPPPAFSDIAKASNDVSARPGMRELSID